MPSLAPPTFSTPPSFTSVLPLLSPWASLPTLARSPVSLFPPVSPEQSSSCSHPSPKFRVNSHQHPMLRRNTQPLACLIHQELLSQPLPGPLVHSLHPMGPASLPPETLLSISCLPRWSQLLSLAVFSLVVYFLSLPSSHSLFLHLFLDLGLLCVAFQGCPAEGVRKDAQSSALTSPSR